MQDDVVYRWDVGVYEVVGVGGATAAYETVDDDVGGGGAGRRVAALGDTMDEGKKEEC